MSEHYGRRFPFLSKWCSIAFWWLSNKNKWLLFGARSHSPIIIITVEISPQCFCAAHCFVFGRVCALVQIYTYLFIMYMDCGGFRIRDIVLKVHKLKFAMFVKFYEIFSIYMVCVCFFFETASTASINSHSLTRAHAHTQMREKYK